MSYRCKLAAPSAPRIGGRAPETEETCSGTGSIYTPGGDELGEATYAVMIKPGEEIIAEGKQWFRVVDVVPFDEEDESPFVGVLTVEAATG